MNYDVPLKVTEIELIYNNKVKAVDRPQITSPEDAYRIFEHNWSRQMSLLEEFRVLLLDRSNRAMSIYSVSRGGVSGTVVDLKIVFAAAIKGRASSIILAHNHPSGNLKPSQADIDLTKKFEEAGKLLDIPVLDHIILSPAPDCGFYSFSQDR